MKKTNHSGININMLKSFVKSLENDVNDLENKFEQYSDTPFNNLTEECQIDFLNSLRKVHSAVWASQKELELLSSVIDKIFQNGNLSQKLLEEKLQQLYPALKKPTGFDDPNLN